MRKLLGALALVGLTAAPAVAAPEVLCRNGQIERSDFPEACRGRGGIAEVQLPRRHWWHVRAPLARCRDGSTDRGRRNVCLYHGGVAHFM